MLRGYLESVPTGHKDQGHATDQFGRVAQKTTCPPYFPPEE